MLAWLNRNGGGRSGQIARALRLARSTTHRILSVLVELGLLRLDPASHQYFLDAGVLELSRAARRAAAAERGIRRLRDHALPAGDDRCAARSPGLGRSLNQLAAAIVEVSSAALGAPT